MKREAVEATPRKAIPKAWKDEALARTGGVCARLGCDVSDGLEFDHVICLGLGGAHEASNIEPLCSPHHKAKTSRDIKMISKAKRINKREAGEVKRKRPIPSRPFPSGKRPFPSRPFPKRVT